MLDNEKLASYKLVLGTQTFSTVNILVGFQKNREQNIGDWMEVEVLPTCNFWN